MRALFVLSEYLNVPCIYILCIYVYNVLFFILNNSIPSICLIACTRGAQLVFGFVLSPFPVATMFLFGFLLLCLCFSVPTIWLLTHVFAGFGCLFASCVFMSVVLLVCATYLLLCFCFVYGFDPLYGRHVVFVFLPDGGMTAFLAHSSAL